MLVPDSRVASVQTVTRLCSCLIHCSSPLHNTLIGVRMKSIGRIFLTGILTILPTLATLYLVVWLFAAVERFLGKQLLLLLPDEYYRGGMGLLAALALIFLIGLLMRAWLFRQLVKAGENLLLKIPLI